eukprot:15341765-Alexandrium_andersonii.AAC.1
MCIRDRDPVEEMVEEGVVGDDLPDWPRIALRDAELAPADGELPPCLLALRTFSTHLHRALLDYALDDVLDG